jgi:hypothetical protein
MLRLHHVDTNRAANPFDGPDGVVVRGQRLRVAAGLVRMMLRGATMALAGRDGIVCLDEAWVFLGAGKTEVDRLARLAGSQRVSPMLARCEK